MTLSYTAVFKRKWRNLADAPDLGSGGRKVVGVRVPPFAPFVFNRLQVLHHLLPNPLPFFSPVFLLWPYLRSLELLGFHDGPFGVRGGKMGIPHGGLNIRVPQ